LRRIVEENELRVLVHGHIHSPSVKWENIVVLVNLGSPTNTIVPFLTKPAVALLRISEDQIEPEIIRVE
jgi:predicted phosphodiesterase